MYIRKVKTKLSDGTPVRYVQLAHNYRDPMTNRSRAQVLFSLGREEEVDHQALKRLISSIERFLSPEEVLQSRAGGTSELSFQESRPLGGAWALQQLWSEIGIDRVIKKKLRRRAFKTPVERAIFAMVANKALAPASKLAVEKWVNNDVCLPGVEEVQVQHLYRALDVLLDMEDSLQEEVFTSVAHLLNLEVDLLFFDTTSTYFEIEDEDLEDPEDEAYTLRRRGYSKDHRPDLAQVVIGLAVTREGIPIRVWTWPGNTTDVTRVKEVKEDLIGWKLGRVISVMDRGFMSEDNLRELQKAGGHYIIGEKMQSGKAAVEEALSRAGRYQSVTHNVEVKELVIGEGEARKRYVLVRNPQQQKKDEEERKALIERLESELDSIKELPNGKHTKAVCALLTHPTLGRYLKQNKSGWPRIDKAKLAKEKRLDGKYLLLTSDDTLPAADVALGYKQLLEVEDSFRTLKQTLELRPVYHRLSRRIKAHVLVCWLALLLIRVAEVRAERAFDITYTWNKMRTELDRMHLGYFESPVGTVRQRTETRPEQERLFKALQVKEPPRFFDIDPRTTL